MKKNGRVVVDGFIDENCFVFSLNLHKIYNPVKGNQKYFFGNDYGPNFSVFGLKDDLFNKSSWNTLTKDNANKYFTYFEKDYEIMEEKKNFKQRN